MKQPSTRSSRSEKGTVFYVSPTGNDRWSGRFPDPASDGTDGPFATVSRARAALRALRNQRALTGPVRIRLRGGTHFLAEPLVLTGRDSGTLKHPVAFEAFAGETPILSGGRRITGWSPGTVNGQPCWTASVPAAAAGSWTFTQLFVNGVRRPRTRLPATGYYRFTGMPAGVVSEKTVSAWHHGPDAALFAGEDIRPWKNLGDVELVTLQLWFEDHHRLRAVDPARRCVSFRARSMGNLRDDKDPESYARYYVENVFEALANPGEWYLDRSLGTLYYLPLPGESPETTEIIAPRLPALVRLAGTPRAPVRHVRFENIAFQHAEWAYGPDDSGSIQAAFKVPGAVVFDWAEDCVLYGCEIAHVAQYGVEMKTGCSGNRVVACALHDLGAGGVRIGHEWMDRTNETSLGPIKPRSDGKPMAAVVSDCQIHDGSLIHLSAIGVWIGNSGHNRILHNHIFNLNYTGISCGWTWGYAPTATVNNLIEHNHIHHINWTRALSDNGGIYTLGIQPGSVVRGNHIHHIGCYGYGGWGIYPDEGSSEFIFENNLVHHTDEAGFSTHYGRDNIVRNNIFALSGKNHVNPGKLEPHRSTIFERNLVWWRQGELPPQLWLPGHYLFRHNLFWNGKPTLGFGNGTTLADCQQGGQHRGTLLANPLFADPDAGDFSLRADSPAFRLGFKPLSVAQTGPRLGGRRPASFSEWWAEPDRSWPIVRTRLELTGAKTIRVTVTNVGTVPATDRLRLRAAPPGKASLNPAAALVVRCLQPGEQRTAEFPIQLAADAENIWVESLPEKGTVHPTLQFFALREPEWRIPRLRPLSSVAEAGKLLAKQAPRCVTVFGRLLAEYRAAVAGEHFVLRARISDAAPRRGSELWDGSCIEVFTHDRDQNGRPAGPKPGVYDEGIRQSFLVPAVGEHTAQGAYQEGGQARLASEIKIGSTRTADGYELTALLPLRLLKIKPESKRFGLELRVFTTLAKGAGNAPFLCFGALTPHHRRAGCATVILQ